MRFAALLLILGSGASETGDFLAFAQEHAPTAAQCQADVAVWGKESTETEYIAAEHARTRDGTPNKTEIAKLSFHEALKRVKEMGTCLDVDSATLLSEVTNVKVPS